MVKLPWWRLQDQCRVIIFERNLNAKGFTLISMGFLCLEFTQEVGYETAWCPRI
jgi:hypothetical protein